MLTPPWPDAAAREAAMPPFDAFRMDGVEGKPALGVLNQ